MWNLILLLKSYILLCIFSVNLLELRIICTFKNSPVSLFPYNTRYILFPRLLGNPVLVSFHPYQCVTQTFPQQRLPLSRTHQKTCITISRHAFILITGAPVQTPLIRAHLQLLFDCCVQLHIHFDLILEPIPR